ncbi:TraR/DksA family transcriptional regulator [Thiomonas bhubaneswarensis]|uniref:Transcriptional regulator, TraR/DksA family n=1 Tax=Thiomonas bhubaneswarensis TaxID=339866 RepID=A0A0K6I2N8_9BURK|nr:TraR/DksA family transcriptional regulator [Thiomonas bhubaneswarensis]CUA97395.1 transcriptional regulator, TraR/DksA family [Thiomonas bhubaneswarensis]
MSLSTEQRQTLRDKLLQRRSQMVDDLRDESISDEGTLAVRSHRGETDDEAVVEAMDAVEIASTARDANELAAIDRALQRLDTPDFGICIDCGAEIETARLMAEPTVLRCTACQQRFEHQHHTPGGARL